MKHKSLIIIGIAFGALIFVVILARPMMPIWTRMGLKPVCIQGEWPHLKFVSCGVTSSRSSTPTPLPLPGLDGDVKVPIIVDDDGSPDGTIALLYFLSNPNFDVQAVTISPGEAHPDVFAGHILQLLNVLGMEEIPVGAGSPIPLEGNNTFPEPWRQASDNFWGIELPPTSASLHPVPSAELIVNTINNSPQPVLVFVSGTHTNLAEALRLNPGIKKNIRAVYIMGGSIYVNGNIKSDWPSIDNNVSEWNIWTDPVAAEEVFASGLPLHLIPLDATRKIIWNQSDLSGWNLSYSPPGEFASKILQWMLDSWSAEGVYIWDLVAAGQATNPSICREVSLGIDIITTPGPEQGRTMVTKTVPSVSVCLDPDIEQVKSLSASIFGKEK